MIQTSIDLDLIQTEFRTYAEEEKIVNLEYDDDGVWVRTRTGGFFLDSKRFKGKKILPKVGDRIVLYIHGGSAVRGIDIGSTDQEPGKNLFFLSDEEINKEREEWLEEHNRQKQEEYERNKDKYQKQYEALPPEFQQRIDEFKKNSKFEVDLMAYELFCCEQAVLIANCLKTPEAVKEWAESDESRWNKVPDLDKGHSGNTMGVSTSMAYWYLKQPDVINRMHGSLAALTGSKPYEETNKRVKLAKEDEE